MTYSSSLAMGRQRFTNKNRNTTSLVQKETKLGPISNTIVLVVLSCLLGLLYLTQVTKTNALGYKINSLQEERSVLQGEHDDLQIASARLQALDRIKNSETAKNMVSLAPSGVVSN